MRQVLNGAAIDTTSSVRAWLKTQGPFAIAELYLIGDFDDPNAIWLTNWPSPLQWSLYGIFNPAAIERGKIDTKIGLDVLTLDLTWHPPVLPYTASLATAGPHQRAAAGVYKNWPVRIWKCYMPTPGDADTYGACELFGGRIGPMKVDRSGIIFTINSFLDVISAKVPAQVIEITNPLASSFGAIPPAGISQIPQFNVIAGSTQSTIMLQCTSPNADQIFAANLLRNGFIVFNDIPGATLARQWSGIQSNQSVTISGHNYNQIQLYKVLPFAPTPGSDTCYISGAAPVNLADGNYQGFPYVPDPEVGI